MSVLSCPQHLEQKGFKQENGVWYAVRQTRNSEKEQMYLSLRAKEGWLYPDDVVAHLPDIDQRDPHAPQWKIRNQSFDRLVQHISQNASGSPLLDLGCGNGWMAGGFARAGFPVCAVDMNKFELRQAARVFGKATNIQWIYGNIFDNIFPHHYFGTIVLASSAQYFPDLRALLARLCLLLAEQGEIHIIDTQFYERRNQRDATERSERYYTGIGFPAFASEYYHHTYDELKDCHYEIQQRRHPLMHVLKKLAGQSDSPFPWIIIRNPCSSTI